MDALTGCKVVTALNVMKTVNKSDVVHMDVQEEMRQRLEPLESGKIQHER